MGPSRMSAVTLALFLLAPQVAIQFAAALFVSIDVLVDPLMAHSGLLFQTQATGNLFRAPLLQ